MHYYSVINEENIVLHAEQITAQNRIYVQHTYQLNHEIEQEVEQALNILRKQKRRLDKICLII